MLIDRYGGVASPPPLETDEPTAAQWRDAYEAAAMQAVELGRLLRFEDARLRAARERSRALEERALAAERACAAGRRDLVGGAAIVVRVLTSVINITRRHR